MWSFLGTYDRFTSRMYKGYIEAVWGMDFGLTSQIPRDFFNRPGGQFNVLALRENSCGIR